MIRTQHAFRLLSKSINTLKDAKPLIRKSRR